MSQKHRIRRGLGRAPYHRITQQRAIWLLPKDPQQTPPAHWGAASMDGGLPDAAPLKEEGGQ